MISELEDNRRGYNFSAAKMDIYAFLYLQYKSLIQNKKYFPDTSEMISNLDVSEEIKQILNKYIKDFPKEYEQSDFQAYSEKRIYRYFSLFRFFCRTYESNSSACEMRSSPNMSFLAAALLKLNKNDHLADFYGAPDSFLKTIQDDEKHRIPFITKPVAFTANEKERDFLILQNDILQPQEYQINICKKDFFSESEDENFNKVFAFIPVFQNTIENQTRRISQNVIYSEDKSYDYILKINKYLCDSERVVICISDSIFSEKAENVRKLILKTNHFEGLIRFPAGEIEPYNLGSSLLIFNKNKEVKSREEINFTFLDLCDVEKTGPRWSTNSSIISQLGIEEIINMFYSEEECHHSVFRKKLSYEDIEKDNYNFDTKWNIDWYLRHYEEDNEEWEPYEAYISNEETVKLSDNAVISRGIQDTEGIKEFETQNPKEVKYRYLSLSDIQDGKINFQTMLKLSGKKAKWEKYFLKEGDVLISKTSFPAFKIAIYEGDDNFVLPASNIFVIRMKFGDECSLNPYYLKLYLESENGLKQLKKLATGAKLPALAKENLENLEIPLKSEEKQKDIEEEYKSLQLQILNLEVQIKSLSEKIKTIIN